MSEQSSSESEPEDPKHKLADRIRREREYSDAGDDIPKMELAKRIREHERRTEDNADASDGMLTASDVDSEAIIDYYLADSMMGEGIQKQQTAGVKLRNIDHKMRRRNEKAKNTKIRTLLSAIAGMF